MQVHPRQDVLFQQLEQRLSGGLIAIQPRQPQQQGGDIITGLWIKADVLDRQGTDLGLEVEHVSHGKEKDEASIVMAVFYPKPPLLRESSAQQSANNPFKSSRLGGSGKHEID